jgi:hypothetical protein
MDDDIPTLTSPGDIPPVRTQEDLHRVWRMLMGPLGFGGHSLWILLLDYAGRPTPTLVQIEDLPPLPGPEVHANMEQFLTHLLPEGHGTAAFLLTRPGRTPITPGERRWARILVEVVRGAKLPVWPVHRANDLDLVVIAPDDLAATG